MKKLFLTLIFIPLILLGQVNITKSGGANFVSKINTTTTELDSAAIFTGGWELCYDYSYIQVIVKSDVSGTAKVQFASTGSATTLLHEDTLAYTANDTITNVRRFEIAGNYYRVIYTNSTTDQTIFYLTTSMLAKERTPVDDSWVPQVSDTSSQNSLDNIKNFLSQIYTKLNSDSTTVKDVLGIKQNQTNGTQKTIVTDLPAITYGSQTLFNAITLDDAPTADTSAAYFIGDKNKVGFSLNYNETETGGGVSGTLTLEVSPDSSTWYAFDIILDGAGLDAPNANLVYSTDATDYFYIPNFVTAGYIRAIFTGTATDADDTILITVVLHWQAE